MDGFPSDGVLMTNEFILASLMPVRGRLSTPSFADGVADGSKDPRRSIIRIRLGLVGCCLWLRPGFGAKSAARSGWPGTALLSGDLSRRDHARRPATKGRGRRLPEQGSPRPWRRSFAVL